MGNPDSGIAARCAKARRGAGAAGPQLAAPGITTRQIEPNRKICPMDLPCAASGLRASQRQPDSEGPGMATGGSMRRATRAGSIAAAEKPGPMPITPGFNPHRAIVIGNYRQRQQNRRQQLRRIRQQGRRRRPGDGAGAVIISPPPGTARYNSRRRTGGRASRLRQRPGRRGP